MTAVLVLTVNLISSFLESGIEDLHACRMVAGAALESGRNYLFFAYIKFAVFFDLSFVSQDLPHQLLSPQFHFLDFIFESYASINTSIMSRGWNPSEG